MSAKPSQSNSNTMSSADAKTAKKPAATKKVAAPAPTATPAAAPAPATEVKAAKAPRKTAAKTEVVVPTVAAPEVVALPASSTTEAAAPTSIAGVVDRLREVRSRLANELKEIIADTLLAAKTAAREVKDAKRKRRVKKDVADMTPEEKTAWELRRSKNAFLKPRALSADLCAFMKLPAGSQRSQTEVTKFVSNYVKENSCFDPSNKRRIIPDGVLSRLLKVKDTDTVTYLNLQSFLKNHFLKA